MFPRKKDVDLKEEKAMNSKDRDTEEKDSNMEVL